jgi:hypothetical protein
MSREPEPAKTISAFETLLDNHRKRLGISKTEEVWFRGQANGDHNLSPGLFRKSMFKRHHEHNMFAQFCTQGAKFVEKSADSWEILSTMQHWGAPTRLLDWTTSLNTALFFALRNPGPKPTIWIANPYLVNEKSVGKRVMFDAFDHPGYDYAKQIREEHWPHSAPIAFSIPWTNARIQSQRGYFTVHGSNTEPLNQQSQMARKIKKVVIDTGLIPVLRKRLMESGSDPFSLFPDVSGLCETLKWQYSLLD